MSYRLLATTVAVILAAFSVLMLRDAMANGPTWYRDYGLYGMQYGARQVTGAIDERLRQSADTIILTPTWANGTDVLVRFFRPESDRLRIRNIDAYVTDRLELDDHVVFVMTPQEYVRTRADPRFTALRVERVIPYPDGMPGFYFVRLRYSPRADAIFAAERRARARLVRETVALDGQGVTVAHSLFDRGAIANVFDGDRFTLARAFEANPVVFRLELTHGRVVRAISVTTATMWPEVRVLVRPVDGSAPAVLQRRLAERADNPTLTVSLGRAVRTRLIEIRVGDLGATGKTHVHVREIRVE